MKIVHIESGLGNQMLSYCEYLVMKQLHPEDDVYLETIVYEIPECENAIKQWNGYELERVFGIKAPNVKELFDENEWQHILLKVKASNFWNRNWNYPVHITDALNEAGLHLRNIRGDFEAKGAIRNVNMSVQYEPTWKERFKDTYIGYYLRRWSWMLRKRELAVAFLRTKEIFYEGTDDVFTGQWLAMRYRGSGMDKIEQTVRESFVFPAFTDDKNCRMAEFLDGCNAVAIHARRGDMLGCNGYCYKFGYFQRAVRYIKKHVKNPVFVFFCDPGSVTWCRDNANIFNLDFKRDIVHFVDWNKGADSFRDMQLMSHCKHAVITNSSFGWWGQYFITNPDKITISPVETYPTSTTIHL